jgi:hypothetical protein
VRQVLEAVRGNKTHAARILGIDRRSLYRRLESPYQAAHAVPPEASAAALIPAAPAIDEQKTGDSD